jgi:hypothetical protein
MLREHRRGVAEEGGCRLAPLIRIDIDHSDRLILLIFGACASPLPGSPCGRGSHRH